MYQLALRLNGELPIFYRPNCIVKHNLRLSVLRQRFSSSFFRMVRQRKKWCSETVDYHKSARPNKILSRAMFSTFGTYACRKIWSLTWSCTNVYAAVYKVRYHGHVIPTCTRQSHLRNRGHVVPMFTGQSDIRKRDDVSICTRQTSEGLAVFSNHMWESDSEQQTIT